MRINLAKLIIGLGVFFTFIVPVSAQYDTEQITPKFTEQGEVYGINVEASGKVSFYPTGCESIDKITLEAKNPIDGQLIINKVDENPQPDADKIDKVFEYCQIELENINPEDINKAEVELKVRKNWLEDESLTSGDMAFFTFDGENWNQESTTLKTESSVYFFFDSETENLTDWAVGHNAQNSIFDFQNVNVGVVLLCCIVSLLVFIMIGFAISNRSRD